jgi:1-acyl-sn-glycerol-3-phosphate acyltransferase
VDSPSDPSASTADTPGRADAVIAVVRKLAQEARPRARSITVEPTTRLDRDLGIDSLGRSELILRIERVFRVKLPLKLVGEAETVADLLRALDAAQPAEPEAAAGVEAALTADAPVGAPDAAQTLVEVLEWHAAKNPDRLHITLLEDDAAVDRLTYRDLAVAAREVAAGLVEADIVPGDRVALMLPTGIDFFVAFYGILYAGAVPVPIYPPVRLSQIEEHLRRQGVILHNAGARMLITVPEGRGAAALLRGQVETLTAVESVATLKRNSEVALPAVRDPQATAFIQYTSGSTGDPKGVVLSHANLLANIRAMIETIDATPADVFISWLPLYHDMGLIGAWLSPLYCGVPLYVMSPLSFLARPISWLRAVHRFRGTLSAAPNFAFELCLKRIEDSDLEGLDLSSWRLCLNGAEPVSVETLRRFVERFSRYGLPPETVIPVYGLAECSVGLAIPSQRRLPPIDRVDAEALRRRGVAEAARPGASALEIPACGQPLPGHEIRIVDEAGRELPERHEGRLEFRGPSATSGYFRNEARTKALIRDGWHDSGDRAYVAQGDVYLTGRVKDIIIRAGRNIYPHEVENAVGELPGARKGCVAVFGLQDPASGTERLIVMMETKATDAAARDALQQKAHALATDILGEPPDEIVLVPPQSVPKTSSGKLRRSTARDLYAAGAIGRRDRALWWQVARLSLAAGRAYAARGLRHAGEILYAGWWWLVVALGFLLAWFTTMLLPRLEWRWAAARALARGVLAATGIPVSAEGTEKIPRDRNAVLLFNHASYMDVVALAAVLPGAPAFVAKKEFAGQIFAGPFMRKLGVLFVERFDTAGSLADAEAATTVARGGRALVFFPEGTFTRRAGLSGFYLGAFKVASEAGLPVLPGAIAGTRSMLRGGQWFPRRSAVNVKIGDAIEPFGTDYAAMLRLRDTARSAMLTLSGEPDIGELVRPTALR